LNLWYGKAFAGLIGSRVIAAVLRGTGKSVALDFSRADTGEPMTEQWTALFMFDAPEAAPAANLST